jgi:hypothetical protein
MHHKMFYNDRMATQSCFRKNIRLILCIMVLVFCSPNYVASAEKYYYYLHVSSFRLKKNASQDAARLQDKGYDTTIRREKVANLGYWYRVYVGPFSSLKEANFKGKELKRRKLVEYVAIQKKEELAGRRIPKKPEPAAPPPVRKMPAELPIMPEEIVKAKKPPVSIPSVEEREAVKKPALPTAPEPSAEIAAKPPPEMIGFRWKGAGRNIPQGHISLGLRHTYQEIETELTRRTQITSDGTATTSEEVSLSESEKQGFYTKMHMDSLHIRFGLTNYLEVFADIAGTYRELSDFSFSYGGGLRLNLFEVKQGGLRGIYGALQGEYSGGEVKYDYTSSNGNQWEKEADWQDLSAKGEIGLTRSRFAGYAGAVYFHYSEDTERQLLHSLPPSVTSFVFQDELEQESFGAYGGVVIRLTPAFLVNIEGQTGSQKSIFGALEYHF